MANIISLFYHNPVLSRIFPTLVYCLKKELKGCRSVLDLGCGPSSPVEYCRNIEYSLGVEAHLPYFEETSKKNIHTEYRNERIEDIDFPENSFDAVLMLEVLEHLPEEIAKAVLNKAEKWARKKVIVSSPNGFLRQGSLDNNYLQAHLSGWRFKKMIKLGFKCRGLAGLKILRKEVDADTMGDDLLVSMRFHPKFFWFIISCLSQAFVYFVPQSAFELFSVKEVRK
ncbi:MAG: methyltransferase domain-containing protein [Candidatus Omnitrophota bacterium]|nr:class I SAM-dependent methyltransferase [Candidatus Omnitrophota bacterium]MBU1929452.1 class I SAM-dependent methyltransferase [Candidatus Omnitrophota bacterium]MBU2034824.1 class I SAM-dependent methyltransferase [Candidatus Omnitrophota bacterium]MBU2222040.1 class I SAM-dependent methyltransferase [Candidatus Omnitrophota bacterium]MBU2258007.1 class I SAM-dependent methyltransferase [Candidatus Omnitrophota bacterium]